MGASFLAHAFRGRLGGATVRKTPAKYHELARVDIILSAGVRCGALHR